jgi:hypothetical protein
MDRQVVKAPRLDTLPRASALCTDSYSLLKLDLVSSPAVQGPNVDLPSTSTGSDNGPVPLLIRQVASEGYCSSFELTAQREERIFALMLWLDVTLTVSAWKPLSTQLSSLFSFV